MNFNKVYIFVYESKTNFMEAAESSLILNTVLDYTCKKKLISETNSKSLKNKCFVYLGVDKEIEDGHQWRTF